MRFNKLDLNLLIALDALIDERSVSAAANRVHLSQSAMSGALARLRAILGDAILVQQGRGMAVTPRAVEISAHVKEVLARVERDVLTHREFNPATSQRALSIMASDYATAVILAPAFRDMSLAAPGMRFNVVPMASDPDAALEHGDAKLLIIPEVYAFDTHRKRTLLHEDYVCVAWRGNRQLKGALTKEQFWEARHVCIEFERSRARTMEAVLHEKHGRRIVRGASASIFGLAPFLVAGTDRLALMHRRLAAIYAEVLGLSVYETPVAVPPVVEVIQWLGINDSDDGLMWVVNQIAHASSRLQQEAPRTIAAVLARSKL